MPVYHFRERHRRRIHATTPEAVWRALRSVTLNDLALTRMLVAVRGLKGDGSKPIFDGGPIRLLEVDEPSYAIGAGISRAWQPRPSKMEVSTVDEFTSFREPGWTKYLTDFRVEPVGDGVVLSTETRGYSTDTRSRLLFGCYWAVIRPGSGLVRRDVLAAVARLTARH